MTVPTLAALVEPLNALTRVAEQTGGSTKSFKELEIDLVAPPSTKMSKESESKDVRVDPGGMACTENPGRCKSAPILVADLDDAVAFDPAPGPCAQTGGDERPS